MKIYDLLYLLPAAIIGIALGILFFGGLWITVQRGLVSKRPTLLFLGSLIARIGIVVVGFYYVASDNWQKMLACLIGFIIARILVTYMTKQTWAVKVFRKQQSNAN